MDTKQFTTLSIGLIVGVVLIAGMMAPVIGGLIDGGGSSSGGSENALWYYRNIGDDETHTIRVVGPTTNPDAPELPPESAHTGAPVYLDGELLTVLDTESPDGFILPLWISDDDEYNIGLLGSTTMIWWGYGYPDILDGSIAEEYVLIGAHSSGFVWILGYNDTLEYTIEGTEVTSAILYSDGSSSDISQYSEVSIKALITPESEGDYVLCTSPTVQEDTEIILLDQDYTLILRTEDTRGEYHVVTLTGKGTVSSIENTVAPYGGDWAYSPFGGEDWWWEGYMSGISSVSVNTEETAGGIRLDSITAKIDWTENDGFNVSVNRFIVPVEAGSGSDGSSLSPTLATLLSVIPLLTAVGLVLGTIMYFRRA